MPELPEVETVRRGIEKAARGKAIGSVRVNRRDLRFPIDPGFEMALAGRKIESLGRRGKYVLITVSGGPVVILHLGMSGRVRVYGPLMPYEAHKHDHVIITLVDDTKLVFEDPRRFGFLLLSDKESWESHAAFAEMGPEPLGNDFNGPVLYRALSKRQSPVKVALLNQNVVAGLGNIYVCEALYRAGISPLRRSSDISEAEAQTLTRHIRAVLEDAIKAGGSTLRDYQKTDGSLGYFQYSFSVYDREGHGCPGCSCDESIKRIVQVGRSTFYCAARQK